MPEQDFTNREIQAMFQEIKNGNTRIEEQTKKHNGRLTNLERWQAHLVGAFSVLTIVIVPILGWALYSIVTIDHKIQEALSVNEIP